MSLFSKLFGGSGSAPKPDVEAEVYEGFRITPDPMKEGAAYRVRAHIEKEIGGELKEHTLIRADVINDLGEAIEASTGKAKQMIDQMGDMLFK